MGITQYYSILYGYFNINQYYLQYWVVFNSTILNILYNITQYYMDITILLNIKCDLGSIQFNTTEHYRQYYSLAILHVKLYNITQYYMRVG